MASQVEMTGDGGVRSLPNIVHMLGESVGQPSARLSNVELITKTASNAIYQAKRSAWEFAIWEAAGWVC